MLTTRTMRVARVGRRSYTRAYSVSAVPRRITKRSETFIPVHFEPPKDAVVASHRLLIQAGFIRQASAGIYNFLPLAQRTLTKLVNIIDEEMQAIGGQKIIMPKLQASEVWKATGRWNTAGEELFRLKDRHAHEYCLSPTHEEIVTMLAANDLKSYKQLPVILYQIGDKWRDEARPRFGLIRGREFLMKDMYSFDISAEAAHNTYAKVMEAYHRVMKRVGIPYVVAEADSGNIGGNKSHEFHAITDIGEDYLLMCDCGNYHANVEKAKGRLESDPIESFSESVLSRQPPRTLDELLHESTLETRAIDSWLFVCDDNKSSLVVVITPRDREVNQFLVKSFLNATSIQFYSVRSETTPNQWNDEAKRLWRESDHSLTRVLIDSSLSVPSGTSERQVWWKSVVDSLAQHNTSVAFGDFRMTRVGDKCPGPAIAPGCCGERTLKAQHGIEVGHLFYLGTKYSSPLNASVLKDGKSITLEMGCFGIGVSRLLATTIETSHDAKGIIWPLSLAPYKAIIISGASKNKDADLANIAEELYSKLESAVPSLRGDMMLDDRLEETIGFKLKEACLIGYPYLIVVGASLRKMGKFEVEVRKTGEKMYLTENELIDFFNNKLV